jgi:transcriptional regulator with XRE-family HTH domain
MILGQLLIAWRKQHKCSRRKLATQIGIDHVTLSRVENGDSNSITLDNLSRIINWVFQS